MIMTQGGWGVVEEIDLLGTPARVVVANTPEPRQLGQTGRASCHIARGIYTGYLATVLGMRASGVETTCRSRGDARCTFEVTLTAPA
jgi:predicted hydrocarbon binding protein